MIDRESLKLTQDARRKPQIAALAASWAGPASSEACLMRRTGGTVSVREPASRECRPGSHQVKMSVHKHLYPECAAGGFSRVDGTIEFYTRVNALLSPDMTVLDFGAGRGAAAFDDSVTYRRGLRNLRGKVERVIGVDVSESVRQNPTLDEAHVIQPAGGIPIADGSVDMIVSDSTFEHLPEPVLVASEFDRVLKTDGWICARTPNRWGYVAIGARIVPEWLQDKVVAIAQPDRKLIDVFPTYYFLNTKSQLQRYFPPPKWIHYTYGYDAEPAYFGKSKIMNLLMIVLQTLTPQRWATTFMVFIQKTSE